MISGRDKYRSAANLGVLLRTWRWRGLWNRHGCLRRAAWAVSLSVVIKRRRPTKPANTDDRLVRGHRSDRLRDVTVSVITLRHYNRTEVFGDNFGGRQLVQVDRVGDARQKGCAHEKHGSQR